MVFVDLSYSAVMRFMRPARIFFIMGRWFAFGSCRISLVWLISWVVCERV